MRGATVFSFAFHALVIGTMWVTLPSFFDADPLEDAPIIVEMVLVEEETLAPESAPEREEPSKEVPMPASKPVAERHIVKELPPPAPPKPDRLEPIEKKKELNLAEPTPPALQPITPEPPLPTVRPKKKPVPPSKSKQFDPGRIALLIDKTRKKKNVRSSDAEVEKRKKDFLKRPATTDQPVRNARVGPRLTMRDIDAIRHQIERNWTPPGGARNAEGLIIRVRIGLNPDGSLRGVPKIVDIERMKDGFYRAAADSALRAVYKSEPLRNLPKGKYKAWRDITLTFNPKELLGGR